MPNLQSATFISKFLGKISLSVTPRTIRTVDFKGGIDNFLLNTKAKNLTEEGQKLRRKLKKLVAANDNAKPAKIEIKRKKVTSARKEIVALVKKSAPAKKEAAQKATAKKEPAPAKKAPAAKKETTPAK